MTRKRYVKLLMAMGYQRNTAQLLALLARAGGCTYKRYLERERLHHAHNRAMVNLKCSLIDMFTPAVAAFSEATDALRDAFAGLDLPKVTEIVAPLTTSNLDGFVAGWADVDEVSQWPKENPHLGGGGHD